MLLLHSVMVYLEADVWMFIGSHSHSWKVSDKIVFMLPPIRH